LCIKKKKHFFPAEDLNPQPPNFLAALRACALRALVLLGFNNPKQGAARPVPVPDLNRQKKKKNIPAQD